MTREKALEAMDRLIAMGYSVALTEHNMGDHVMVAANGGVTSIARHLSVGEISLDKVDLRALVAVADDLELDVGMWALGEGKIHFTDQPSEGDVRRAAVVSGRRHHPR